MNPLSAIRELMESYVEGVRVSKFGPGYKLKEEAAILDIENARARAAEFKLQSGRDTEMHAIRLTAEQRAAERDIAGKREDDLKWATRRNAAVGDKHAADDAGIAEHEAEQEALKQRRDELAARWAETQPDRYADTLADRDERGARADAAAARADAAAGRAGGMAELLAEIRRQQAAGIYNPDRNNPDAKGAKTRPLSKEELEDAAYENLTKRGIAEPSGDELTAEMDAIYAKRMGSFAAGAAPPPASTAPVRISGDADYAKLSKGAAYIGPDGVPRIK